MKVGLSEILGVQLKEATPAGATVARWIGHDIGSPPVQGSARFVGENVMIRGSGSEIGLDKDEGYFVYQQLVGDGQITARISSLSKTNILAKAGGPLLVGFGSEEDETERLRHGRIWDGGISLIDRPYYLVLKSDQNFARVANSVR